MWCLLVADVGEEKTGNRRQATAGWSGRTAFFIQAAMGVVSWGGGRANMMEGKPFPDPALVHAWCNRTPPPPWCWSQALLISRQVCFPLMVARAYQPTGKAGPKRESRCRERLRPTHTLGGLSLGVGKVCAATGVVCVFLFSFLFPLAGISFSRNRRCVRRRVRTSSRPECFVMSTGSIPIHSRFFFHFPPLFFCFLFCFFF